MQRGNRNRATLTVARKMVAWMVAVERRKQDFVPAEERGARRQRENLPYEGKNIRIIPMRRLPGPAVAHWAKEGKLPRLPLNCFGTGREHMYGPPPCRKQKMKTAVWSTQMYPVFVEL